MNRTAALASLLNRPLAWERSSLDATLAALHAAPELASPQASTRNRSSITPAVGVLPIVGPISYRPSIFSFFFASTAVVDARETLAQLLRKSDVETIIMLVDSPGGEITGLEEFSYELRQARQIKPIIAVVDCLCASAAYHLTTQATEIVTTASGRLGSVGVYWLHVDQSQLLANAGVRPTYIHAGRYKVEGNSLEPLSDEAHREFQRLIDSAYDTFVSDIVKGRGRGLTAERVRKEFGEGRMVEAADALRRGMVDRIFPTTAAAYNYAVNGFRDERARRADLDHVDLWLYEHGSKADRLAASARLRARQVDHSAQLRADRDYVNLGVRIAERAGNSVRPPARQLDRAEAQRIADEDYVRLGQRIAQLGD